MGSEMCIRDSLWEMYLIEGLENGNFAVVTKSHQVLVDGTGAIDIAQVMLDSHAEVSDDTPDVWNPRPEPSDPELIGSALSSILTRPTVAWDVLNTGVRDVGAAAEAVAVWAKDTSVGLAKSVYAMIR